MKKYLGIGLCLLLLSVVVSIKHQDYADNPAADGGNQGLPVSMAKNPAKENNPDQPKNGLSRRIEQAYLFIGWPNGITVWALLLTMVVIAEQTRETRRAAIGTENSIQAIKRQTVLAEAGMKQWIELTGWESELTPGNRMQISFRVSNPTNLLITTERGRIDFTAPEETQVTFIYRPAPLAPNHPLTVRFFRPLTQLQADAYAEDLILGFTVSGFIIYRNAFDKKVVQRFAGLITSSRKETKFEATIDIGKPEDDGGKKPN